MTYEDTIPYITRTSTASDFERSCQTVVVVAVELKPPNVANLHAISLHLTQFGSVQQTS